MWMCAHNHWHTFSWVDSSFAVMMMLHYTIINEYVLHNWCWWSAKQKCFCIVKTSKVYEHKERSSIHMARYSIKLIWLSTKIIATLNSLKLHVSCNGHGFHIPNRIHFANVVFLFFTFNVLSRSQYLYIETWKNMYAYTMLYLWDSIRQR